MSSSYDYQLNPDDYKDESSNIQEDNPHHPRISSTEGPLQVDVPFPDHATIITSGNKTTVSIKKTLSPGVIQEFGYTFNSIMIENICPSCGKRHSIQGDIDK